MTRKNHKLGLANYAIPCSSPSHEVVSMSHPHPSPAKIFVLGNGSLLDEGIGNMLSLHSQLSVTRILYTDEHTLYDLVNFEHPYVVFINEFDKLDMERIIRLIFFVPSAFVRRVIVVHLDDSKLDVYNRSTTNVPVTAYRRKSIAVHTKDEFIKFALSVSACAA
jgi:hypothetical protein